MSKYVAKLTTGTIELVFDAWAFPFRKTKLGDFYITAMDFRQIIQNQWSGNSKVDFVTF